MSGKPNIGAKITLEGEREYRQAINNVSKTMSVLKSELKAVSAEYEGNANSLEALRVKNDILTKQQKEQEEKLKLLRGALENVSQEYGENSKQAQDWQIKLNNAYAELQKINRELDTNEKYMKEAEQSTDKTAKSIDEFGRAVKESKEETLSFGDVLKANLASDAIINGVKALYDAIKDGSRALVNVVKDTAAYADNILTLSTQTGIATGTLQELNYMAELTDVSLDTVTKTMARNIRSMENASNGTRLYVDAYRQLGVQITDTNGQLRNSEAVYWDVLDALEKMTNETERDAIAMQLFGRSAQDLNPLIKIGKDGMNAFAKEARNMGAVLSDETLEGLGKTDDAIQRLTQQIDIAKRKIGLEAAPGITEAIEKITTKVGEADDKFAEFVSGGINGVVDGFVWLIDNIDLVIAGLKGVTAAFVTKKAAEGVEFAIQAYKTLTTTTQAATTAQTAFNTAAKANVIGAIASVVIGLGTALYTYTKNAKEAAEETEKLNSSTYKLHESVVKLNEETQKSEEKRKKTIEAIEAEKSAAITLAKSLYELADKENKSSSEKAQMVSLVNELNEIVPKLNLNIEKQTGFLSLQREEVDRLIESQYKLNMAQAAQKDMQEIANQKYQAEKKLSELMEEREKITERINKAQEEYNRNGGDAIEVIGFVSKAALSARNELLASEAELLENQKDIESLNTLINKLSGDYKKALDYVGKYSPVEDIARSSKQIVEQYKASIEDIAENAADAVEDATEKINDIYDKASDELKKRQKAERKAFEETQKEQVKTLEKAQKEQLKTIETAHKLKLKYIDEEYLEKMKNIDEDRYKELKAIQEQIDAIDAQQEAEDRATKLKEEAEKRAELKARIENAKTIEDRLEAQKDLVEFEEDVAKDRLKAERTLQKDILKEQKDKINESYDAKIKALEEEQKKAEEVAKANYESEKELIETDYQDKIETLKKVQEAEKESFEDRQGEYKEYLKKQKDLAIENAQKTYEEDLRLFKLNNSLKEKEITQSDYLKKIDIGSIKSDDILSGKYQITSEMLQMYSRYGAPSAPQSQVTQQFTLDYDELVDAFTAAIKKLNLTVVLDNKKVGTIVESTVNKMIN